jgi:hypothetical protein
MANLSAAKNALNLIASKSSVINLTNTGTKRGSAASPVVPDNCVFVFVNGYVAVNNPKAPSINFILEGGSSQWDQALVQTNIFPYYSPAQMTTLKILINYCRDLNKDLYLNSDIFI